MKTIFNKKFLYTILLLSAGLFMAAPSKAQDCSPPCSPGPLLWTTIPLCSVQVDSTGTCYLNGTPITGYTQNIAWSKFVSIAYRLVTCNGNTDIIIEGYVFVNEEPYYSNCFPPFTTLGTCPPWESDLQAAVSEAVGIFLGAGGPINPQQLTTNVTFKASCYSAVSLQFPPRSFVVDSAFSDTAAARIDTFYFNGPVKVIVPCDDACCQVRFRLQQITLTNGETTLKWVAVSSASIAEGNLCGAIAAPDYTSFNPKFEATYYDPATGQAQTTTGNVINQTSCTTNCSGYVTAPQFILNTIESDKQLSAKPLELSVNPTLFDKFIQISTDQKIEKVVVYDIKGKLVLNEKELNQGKLNTDKLTPGTYYLQVYFDNREVKTIKVIKQ
jgi:hypothetical protein